MKRPAAIALLALAGCDLSMNRQDRHEAQSSATWWPSGPEATAAPEGTVALDDPARAAALATPPVMTEALLRRGQERFAIFCAPCHGGGGEGDGIVVQRGFPRPPSLAADPARVTAAHVVDVIGRGYGIMYSYGDRIEPADRWAIAGYVRALQRARAER